MLLSREAPPYGATSASFIALNSPACSVRLSFNTACILDCHDRNKFQETEMVTPRELFLYGTK